MPHVGPVARAIRIAPPLHECRVVAQVGGEPVEIALFIGPLWTAAATEAGDTARPSGVNRYVFGRIFSMNPRAERILRLLPHDLHHHPLVVGVLLVVTPQARIGSGRAPRRRPSGPTR